MFGLVRAIVPYRVRAETAAVLRKVARELDEYGVEFFAVIHTEDGSRRIHGPAPVRIPWRS